KFTQCFEQAVGRFIKNQCTGFPGEGFQPCLPPFFYRKEPLEAEAVAGETRGNQCRHKGRCSGEALHGEAMFDGFAHQQEARIGYCRCAGIGYQRHGLAFPQKADDFGHGFVFVVLVMCKHLPGNAEMLEHRGACACVFCQDEIRFLQYADGTQRHIFQITDGGGDEVKHFYYFCRYKIRKYMLQVNYIRENRDQVVERLAVRNFRELDLVDDVIALDERRRQIQTEADSIAAAANAAARRIGELMRQGKRDEAEAAKAKSGGYKEQQKKFADELSAVEAGLYQKLVLLPNLPHQSVPKGVSADDNEVVLEYGEWPDL